ncbi:NADH-quinone oxidoreductase subunit NuoH [Phenylobacterium sp. J367]|uniref:NADH-quinone oxidoreductase subunit NuoH n=1 Tax=Phenylobacterium sp. J367 TaxID=2898435 RepID=UPI0021512A1D|nr:NADH-quinone oxidoreductase subunit NuoH [Phenylobacterium sp. J367]MCR5880491.1 NADH-quinone oxidoreductase subunit NuoH [Phenylobacterium sp. J367]
MEPATQSFWATPVGWTIGTVAHILAITVVLLLCIAFIIYGDRKIFAGAQMRKGPNVVGPFGLLQSFADLGKFLIKELIIPAGADKAVFLLAPIISVTLALGAWAVMPVAPNWVVSDINVGILYLFAVSSLGVYGIIMGGWASNSKYPFLGSLRSAAQMVSYEVSIGFVIVTVILLAGSMNLTAITQQQAGGFWNWNMFGGGFPHNLPLILVMFPMGVIFFISSLAETNRPPFDLPEAESELVAGYAVEYGSTPYMLFYLAETANIVLMSGLMAVLFLGGWHAPWPEDYLATWPAVLVSLHGLFFYMAKTFFVFFMNAMVRAITPRYRYDQLMRLGWKIFLPTSLVAVALVAGWRVYA